MDRDPAGEWREAVIYGVGRPLLLVFWSLVLWGTLFGGHLVLVAVDIGVSKGIQQTLSSKDSTGGILNLLIAGLAAIVWCAVGLACFIHWRKQASK